MRTRGNLLLCRDAARAGHRALQSRVTRRDRLVSSRLLQRPVVPLLQYTEYSTLNTVCSNAARAQMNARVSSLTHESAIAPSRLAAPLRVRAGAGGDSDRPATRTRASGPPARLRPPVTLGSARVSSREGPHRCPPQGPSLCRSLSDLPSRALYSTLQYSPLTFLRSGSVLRPLLFLLVFRISLSNQCCTISCGSLSVRSIADPKRLRCGRYEPNARTQFANAAS